MAINKLLSGIVYERSPVVRNVLKNIETLMLTLWETQMIHIQRTNAGIPRAMITLHYC